MLLIKPFAGRKAVVLFSRNKCKAKANALWRSNDRGREAGFSTPQPAKNASCSGRNDDCSIWKRKTKAKASSQVAFLRSRRSERPRSPRRFLMGDILRKEVGPFAGPPHFDLDRVTFFLRLCDRVRHAFRSL